MNINNGIRIIKTGLKNFNMKGGENMENSTDIIKKCSTKYGFAENVINIMMYISKQAGYKEEEFEDLLQSYLATKK